MHAFLPLKPLMFLFLLDSFVTPQFLERSHHEHTHNSHGRGGSS